jgi:hypothetical protein
MSKSRVASHTHARVQARVQGQLPLQGGSFIDSSPGKNSLSITPKDVDAEAASAKDVLARPVSSGDQEERQQALLDDAIDLSFPASDPLAVSITPAPKKPPAHH